MSQWGAYQMAKEGKRAKDILNYYFKGINIVKIWD
jgi:stage II sporulation protein D